ncbi:putative translation machinery-associated protein 16 [Blattamonas nauphoetae]|uniref:Translation machinery-associated protein 16 n=1 Tax=Blattamonas nauphoetae TaxID=2049346 RepID=A0ABQ9XCR5_9EUKA|nr:putative translation machinery-associated protein 16 [Blattamonas nauphoetae]
MPKVTSKKIMHPNSRKAKRAIRDQIQKTHIAQKRKEASKDRSVKYRIIKFIHKRIANDEREVFTIEEGTELVAEFVASHDDYLLDVARRREQGKQISTTLLLQEQEWKKVKQEFLTGIESPDLTDRATVHRVKNWNKDERSLPTFKMRLYRQPDESITADLASD